MSDAPPPGPPSSAPPGASPFASLASPRYAWALPLLIALAYLIFYQVVLRLPGSVGAQITSTLISLGLLVWLAAQFARTIRTPGVLLLHLLAALLLFVLFAVLLSRENRLWLDGHIPGLRDV